MAESRTKGTLLQVSISSVYTTIAQRVSVKPNKSSRNSIETTDLDDDAETSLAGILRSGEVVLNGNLDTANAGHAYLWSSHNTAAGAPAENWKIILTDTGASEYAFSGWIMDFEVGEATIDGLNKFTMTIKITGVVTLTP